MRYNCRHIFTTLLVLSVFVSFSEAKLNLNGELGVELEGQTQFKQDIGVVSDSTADTLMLDTYTNTISRMLSNHFLNLNLTTPIVNENFATFSGRAKYYGSYDVSNATRGDKSTYHNPKLHTYAAGMSMFPNRPYPLMLNIDRSFDRKVRSEENNRAKVDFLSPELNLVRKYESENSSRGALWKFAFNENMSLTTDYRQNKSETIRIYDYSEYLDIFIDTTQRLPDDAALSREVIFINSLPDDTVDIFLDFNLIPEVTLSPGEQYIVDLTNESHYMQFIPQVKYNDWEGYYNINYFEKFDVVASEILSPRDLDQQITSFSSNFKTEGFKNFISETRYEYSDSRESYQNMSTMLGTFNNNMSYDISRNSKINMMTIYTDNRTKLDTLATKLNRSLMNQTVIDVGKRGKITNSLTHTYTNMSTVDDVVDLTSTTNIFRNQTTIPAEKYHYEGNWKNSATLLKDNTGYTSNLYGTDYTSKFDLQVGIIEIVPQHQIKYSFSKQIEADSAKTTQKTNEIQNKFNLDVSIPDFLVFGKFRAKGEFDTRTQDRGNNSTERNRYLLDLSSARTFGDKIKLLSTASVEKETTGGSQPVAGINEGQSNTARDAIVKYLYKLDLQTSPAQDIQINANLGQIIQGDNVITRFGFSYFGRIPLLNLPIKSLFSTEKREVGNSVPAIQTRLETKFDFRFRQISFVFSHLYTYESRGSLIYKDHEIRAKISRQFTVM